MLQPTLWSKRVLLVLFALAVVLTTALSGQGITSASVVTTLNAVEDSSVYHGDPTANSNGTSMLVRYDIGNFGNEAFLKFDTSGVGSVTSATLRVYGAINATSDPFDVGVYGVDDDSWVENQINWNNRPSASTAELDTAYITSTEQYYELDVTSYVTNQSDGTVSLVLKGVQPYERAFFHSSENASNPPELVIDSSGDPGTDPDPDPDPTPAVGFTELEPSSDSQLIYVSNDGNDNATGTINDPVATITQAVTMVRDGHPDWILLKRGDVWKDQKVGSFIDGPSPEEPAVITYYGESGPRPILKVSQNFFDSGYNRTHNLALVGLHVLSYKMDPNDPEFDRETKTTLRFVGSGDSLLIEDCVLQYTSILIQGRETSGIVDYFTNVRLNRNMILDNYNTGSTYNKSDRTSGLYVWQSDGLTITENVFDHNGWNPDYPDTLAGMFSHNVYISQHNVGNSVLVKGNILARGASHGIHGRPGGLYEDNLFVRNSIGLQLGYEGDGNPPLAAGVFATARDNVILDGKRMICCGNDGPAQTAAVYGLRLENLGSATVTVDNNIAANRLESGTNQGITNLPGVTYTDNVQYDWDTNPSSLGDMNDPNWIDPERSVGSYHASLGQTGTLDAFMDEVRSRGLGEWDEDYAAYAVNDYIRAGFNK